MANEYHPISAKDLSRLHQFGHKVLPGVFLGNVLYAVRSGKETFWSQTSRSWKGRTHQKSTQETPKVVTIFKFPIADGKVKLSGGEHVLRTLNMEKNLKIFEGNPRGLQRHKTHCWVTVKHETTSGRFQETTKTAITLNQESNCTRRERSLCQFRYDTLT